MVQSGFMYRCVFPQWIASESVDTCKWLELWLLVHQRGCSLYLARMIERCTAKTGICHKVMACQLSIYSFAIYRGRCIDYHTGFMTLWSLVQRSAVLFSTLVLLLQLYILNCGLFRNITRERGTKVVRMSRGGHMTSVVSVTEDGRNYNWIGASSYSYLYRIKGV